MSARPGVAVEPHPAQACLYSRQELSNPCAFHDVVVRANGQCVDLLGLVVYGAQDDHRCVRNSAHSLADLGAAETGEHQVEQKEVRRVLVETAQGFTAVTGGACLEPGVRQRQDQSLEDVRAVIYDKNFFLSQSVCSEWMACWATGELMFSLTV